jgi:hypothetical protein
MERALRGLGDLMGDAGALLPILAARYPLETGRMARAYRAGAGEIEAAQDPLLEAARRAGALGILRDVYGEGPGGGDQS